MPTRKADVALLTIMLLYFAFRVEKWALAAQMARTASDATKASPFLQTYSPLPVVDASAEKSLGGTTGSANGQTATGGEDAVHNDREFRAFFVAQRGKRVDVVTALDRDLLTQLQWNHMTVLFHTGNASIGFHTVYRVGRTLGVVDLQPVDVNPGIHRGVPLPPCYEDMAARVSIAETWFRSEKAASSAFRQTGLM